MAVGIETAIIASSLNLHWTLRTVPFWSVSSTFGKSLMIELFTVTSWKIYSLSFKTSLLDAIEFGKAGEKGIT
jgi:hypothetical protein